MCSDNHLNRRRFLEMTGIAAVTGGRGHDAGWECRVRRRADEGAT